MPRRPADVTDAELGILQVLWDQGEATVRAITAERYPTGTDSDLATVQKLLQRLENKGFVKRDRTAWPHVYTASCDKSVLIGRRLQTTADELCGGAFTPLLTHLIQGDRLNSKDRQALRDLLDEYDEDSSRKRKTKGR